MQCSRLLVKSLVAIWMLPLSVSACSSTNQALAKPSSATEVTSSPLQETVARVNGTAITLTDLNRSKKIIMASQPGMQIPPFMVKEFERRALDQLIGSELLFEAGRNLPVKDLDNRADAKVAQIKASFRDEKSYSKELQSLGMNEKAFRESTKRDLVIANLVESKIATSLAVSEDEIKKYYDANPDKFLRGEQVKVSHILIGADAKAGAAEKKNAREKAEKLQKELAGGADFAKLAGENSTCPSGKQGGDLGYFGKGRMVPPFEQAAFALKPGETSGVVETSFGYHIIKMTERKPAGKTPIEKVRPAIEAMLKAQKSNAAVAAFVEKARKQAKVEVLLQFPTSK